MFKALQKAPLTSWQVNANFHGYFGHAIKTPTIPWYFDDSAELKTQQFSPAMSPLSPAQMGMGFQ